MSQHNDLEELKALVVKNGNIPPHIAIIMDGNGRWAQKQNMQRIRGHHAGVQTVRLMVEACREIGVKILTLYAFSEENWRRPKTEVSALMTLLQRTVRKEIDELDKNKVRLMLIGRTAMLESGAYKGLLKGVEQTKYNDGLKLVLALSYGSRTEILDAIKKILTEVAGGKISAADVSEELLSHHLYTSDLPDPDLLIRTSGEMRVSNFLLWQIAYTEIWLTDILWPDFSKADLMRAILDYQKRERRFGMVSDQLKS